jgi:hypothetical protein
MSSNTTCLANSNKKKRSSLFNLFSFSRNSSNNPASACGNNGSNKIANLSLVNSASSLGSASNEIKTTCTANKAEAGGSMKMGRRRNLSGSIVPPNSKPSGDNVPMDWHKSFKNLLAKKSSHGKKDRAYSVNIQDLNFETMSKRDSFANSKKNVHSVREENYDNDFEYLHDSEQISNDNNEDYDYDNATNVYNDYLNDREDELMRQAANKPNQDEIHPKLVNVR